LKANRRTNSQNEEEPILGLFFFVNGNAGRYELPRKAAG
jgi:hypothetical protein